MKQHRQEQTALTVRRYLEERGVCIDGLCGASFSQKFGNFSDVIIDENTQFLKIYVQEQYGRFGNNIHQILNSLIVARGLSIKHMYYNFFIDQDKTSVLQLDDMILNFGICDRPPPPQISHTMFQLQGFENFINNFSFSNVKHDAEKLGKLLFADEWRQTKNHSTRKIAFYFRAGDIFSTDVSPIYAQPPLAYYIICHRHICSTLENYEIYLVYENELNPCVGEFRSYLAQQGETYVNQSASFIEDAGFMSSVECIVSAFSSFSDALALMSVHLRRWYPFRSIAAYEGIDLSISREFAGVLLSDDIEVFRIIDTANSYMKIGEWKNTQEQRELMVNYHISNLAIKQEKQA